MMAPMRGTHVRGTHAILIAARSCDKDGAESLNGPVTRQQILMMRKAVKNPVGMTSPVGGIALLER